MFLSGKLEYAYSTSKKHACIWFRLGQHLNHGHEGFFKFEPECQTFTFGTTESLLAMFWTKINYGNTRK